MSIGLFLPLYWPIFTPRLASFYTKIKTKKKKERRKRIRGESENERWCDEMRKFGEVFIGWNGNIGYNYNKCRQKKLIKHVKKRVE